MKVLNSYIKRSKGDFLGRQISNLVFEGGGILGISYLGVLNYLYDNGLMSQVQRVAGTSAGAITACITSLNLSFEEIKDITNTLDYKKVPSKSDSDNLKVIPDEVKEIMEMLFGDINCLYRLINNYGWFSTDYFYNWIKDVIAAQFYSTKKKPPYTFSDFQNQFLHKDNRLFADLSIIGTDLSMKTTKVFSYVTTPMMEVAQAVRISMSVPLFFEAVKTQVEDAEGDSKEVIFCDGGFLYNYPLNLYDTFEYNVDPLYGVNMETLGVCFMGKLKDNNINNLLEYIESLLHVSSYIQQEIYESNPLNKERSIVIDTGDVNALSFDVEVEDDKYQFLYQQGYNATKAFFERKDLF